MIIQEPAWREGQHLWCVRYCKPDGSVGNLHVGSEGESAVYRLAVEMYVDAYVFTPPDLYGRRTHRAEWLAPDSAEYRAVVASGHTIALVPAEMLEHARAMLGPEGSE